MYVRTEVGRQAGRDACTRVRMYVRAYVCTHIVSGMIFLGHHNIIGMFNITEMSSLKPCQAWPRSDAMPQWCNSLDLCEDGRPSKGPRARQLMAL